MEKDQLFVINIHLGIKRKYVMVKVYELIIIS